MNTTRAIGPQKPPGDGSPVPSTASRPRCIKCGSALEAGDAFCRRCGHRQVQSEAFYYHPGWILVLAFLVLGPLALPLVWKSKRMGRSVKIILAVVIVAYSAFSVYAAYKIGILEYRELSKLNDIMQRIGGV